MKILVFAPHNDDEILGVGGTIKKYINSGHDVYVCEITSGPQYKILQNEARNAHNFLGIKESIFLNLPVNNLRNLEQGVINNEILKVVRKIEPATVFLPHRGDMHLDHGEVAKAVMVAVRPVSAPYVKRIYAYETLSETEWNFPSVDNAFVPNVFIDISDTIEEKITAMTYYKTQIKEFPNPRSIQAIRALSEFRGATICTKNAEAFMLIREIVDC